MARDQTQYAPDDELVRFELGGNTYEMPKAAADDVLKGFKGQTTPMRADEFYDEGPHTRMTADEFYDSPSAPAARPQARASARPVDMDLTRDPEALRAGGGSDASDGDADGKGGTPDGDADDEIDALAAGPSHSVVQIDPFGVNSPAQAQSPDPMGRDMMMRSFGNATPQGVERLPTGAGLPAAYASAIGRTPMAAPSPGPQAPLNDPMARDMMQRAFASAVPQGVERMPTGAGFAPAWQNAVARAPMAPTGGPAPLAPPGGADMDLMNDPEALNALAGDDKPDMTVNPSQDELDAVRKRLAGFRVGAR